MSMTNSFTGAAGLSKLLELRDGFYGNGAEVLSVSFNAAGQVGFVAAAPEQDLSMTGPSTGMTMGL